MSWVRIDDHAHEHPKQLAAGPAACWLWMCGLMYCNRQAVRTGVIPTQAVAALGVANPHKLAERLVSVGLWEPVDGGFFVHDYFDFQPTEEQQAERRAKRVAAGALGGKRSGETRQRAAVEAKAKQVASPNEAHAKQVASLLLAPNEAKANPDPDPVPDKNERPPLIPPVGGEAKSAKARASRTPGSDASPDEVTAWRERWKLGDAEPVEFAKFLDFHRAKGSLMADWGAAWRNWRRNAATFARGSRAPGRTVQPVDMDAPWMREGYGETLGKEGTG